MSGQQNQIKLSTLVLALGLAACSDEVGFKTRENLCEPPASSARFGVNPGPVIEQPLELKPAAQYVNISGTCADGFEIAVDGSGVATSQATTCSSGIFTARIEFTGGDGKKEVRISQKTVGESAVVDKRCFMNDTTPPKVSIAGTPASLTVRTETVVTGSCENGLEVVISGPEIGSPLYVPCIDGEFRAPVSLSGPDGIKNIVAEQVDEAGNSGNDDKDYLKDTLAPAVQITGPAAGSLSTGRINLVGSCESGLPVELVGSGIATVTATNCTAGSFAHTIDLSSGDGGKTIEARQRDLAGNIGSDTRDFIKDGTAPLITITSPAENSIHQSTLTLTGQCETGLPIQLSGGLASPSGGTCSGGSYSLPITLSSGDGTKTILVSQTDAMGNRGSAQRNFIKDGTAPGLRITSPAALSYQGNSIQLEGVCESGFMVQISGAVASASQAACNGGAFSSPVTFSVGDGLKNVVVTQTDGAGNRATDSRDFNKDTTAPVVRITAPAADSYSTGLIRLTGTCETGLNVQLSGSGLSSPNSTACTGNAFSVDVTLSPGDGSKSLTVTQRDPAGNSGSDSRSFNVDGGAPLVRITDPAANSPHQTGLLLLGTCENGMDVRLSGTGLSSAMNTSCVGGVFSQAITFSSGDGVKNIVASQTDSAGNTGSDNRSFLKDTTAPLIRITSPAAGSRHPTGITLSGTCEDGLPVNLSGAGLSSSTSANCQSGAFSLALTFSSGDGVKNIVASQTDAAGNRASDNRDFIKDSSGPQIRITAPAANSLHRGGLTLLGTCEDGLAIQLSGGGLQSPSTATCSSGQFSVAVTFTSGDGSKLISASQTDGAGNTGSDSRSFLNDQTAPVVRITSPAPSTLATTGLTVEGQCETGIDVVLWGPGVASNVGASCVNGRFSGAILFSAGDGTKTVSASQTDAAGNAGTDSRNFIRDSSVPVVRITSPAAGTVAQMGLTLQGNCEAGLQVNLSGSGLQGPANTPCSSAGTFSTNITFTSGDGTKSIIASQTDAGGNVGRDSRDFVKDATAPIIRITSPAAGSTHQGGLRLLGSCETGLTVNLSGAGLQSPATAACSSGQFSVDITFTAGQGGKPISVSQRDAAGNQGSDNRNFISDTAGPNLAITSPAAGTVARSGLIVGGTCEAGSFDVTLWGPGVSGSVLAPCPSGTFSANITFSTGDGTKTVQASQDDSAGNTTTVSRDFVRDSTAPVIRITSPAAGTQVPMGLTLQGTCETGLQVSITGDLDQTYRTPCNSAQFTADLLFSSGDGTKNVTASQTDAAGNTGSDSRAFVKNLPSGYDVFTSQGPGGMVDILFVDDNSASMDPEQTALAQRFSSFAAELTDVDWQIGITTTDCSTGPYGICGSLLPMAGLGRTILRPTDSNFEQIFQNTIQRPETIGCVARGDCPSGREEPLRATISALNKRNSDNAGFFRNGADLAVVVLADEDEQSNAPPTATRGQAVVNQFNSIWPTGKKFISYGIIIQPGDSSCLDFQQRQGGGIAFYGVIISELVRLTSGMTADICQPDYTITLQRIGEDVRRLSESVELSHAPIASSVRVVFTPAFSTTWSVNGTRLTFDQAPPLGTRIEVFYNY